MNKDLPIIFSAPMVCALLAGRKTQTRRLLKADIPDWCDDRPGFSCLTPARHVEFRGHSPSGYGSKFIRLPYAPGDRLYVRECAQEVGEGYLWIYRADYPNCVPAHFDNVPALDEITTPWLPSIFMPKHASRLTLVVRRVRVERLQNISEADAIAEGVEAGPVEGSWRNYGPNGQDAPCLTAASSFMTLWQSLHDKEGNRWVDNPWIVAVSFEVIRGNIARIARESAR